MMMQGAMRSAKLAFLVPTFNGGALLHETVASVGRAGLPPESYEVIVSDNASDDGSVDRLAAAAPQDSPVIIARNQSNIGRVANWNCALEIAETLGFGHAMFLMAGDLLKDCSVLALRDCMASCGASLGMASYEIVDEQLRAIRLARRINWRGASAIAPTRFLRQSLGRGAMLYAPLGANLYRLRNAARLRFDVADASHTDQRATARYATACGDPIVYLNRPVSRWRRRGGRFHSTMTPDERFRSDLRVILESCREAGIEPDMPKINATFLLRRGFHGTPVRPPPNEERSVIGDAISWSWLARLVMRQALHHTPWQIEP